MIISNIKRLLNNNIMPRKQLKQSASAIICDSVYRIDGITDKVRQKKETYHIHLVPTQIKKIQFFDYLFNILSPNTKLIKLIRKYFVAALAVHPDIAKAHGFNIEKTINNDIDIELKRGQFLVIIPKGYIKKLHLLSPLSTSQGYILDCFNSALHRSLKNDVKLNDMARTPIFLDKSEKIK
jgi:uncharacterized protein YifN (PemK superfamily)